MRSRKEIEKGTIGIDDSELILEVLLDIRDLLIKQDLDRFLKGE